MKPGTFDDDADLSTFFWQLEILVARSFNTGDVLFDPMLVKQVFQVGGHFDLVIEDKPSEEIQQLCPIRPKSPEIYLFLKINDWILPKNFWQTGSHLPFTSFTSSSIIYWQLLFPLD